MPRAPKSILLCFAHYFVAIIRLITRLICIVFAVVGQPRALIGFTVIFIERTRSNSLLPLFLLGDIGSNYIYRYFFWKT